MSENRDTSNRLTFEFADIESQLYAQITAAIVFHFNLEVVTRKTAGLDVVFQEFRKGNKIVGLEWDIWFGYVINASTESAESLAQEIAGYVGGKFNA